MARCTIQHLHIRMFLVHHVIFCTINPFNFHQSTKPYTVLQLPRKCATSLPYLPGQATHTNGAGRVLDGVRDPTQGSASLAFSCTGPGLVPVLTARCCRCAGASGCLPSGGCVLHVPSSYQ